MRFRLRFATHDVDLVDGVFVLGREVDCLIHFDDPAASRRHAQIVVGEQGVSIADLGSRNGTFVNSEPLGSAPRTLRPGDQVRIGSEEFTLVVVDTRQDTGLHFTMASRPCPSCKSAVPPGLSGCPSCNTPLDADAGAGDDVSTATLSLNDLAEKALAMGRLTEAQKCLELQVRDFLRRPLTAYPDRRAEEVGGTMLRVAAVAKDVSWVDRLFSLFAARRWRLPLSLSRQARGLLAELGASRVGLDEYLELWQAHQAGLPAEDRAELEALSALRPT